ncbi:uncharacterized protein EDB93DRAFT_1246766 [Suillus bovinus]|uniref:uncharacterized protein n=1 Tax=Suillus bovinus TaxID=48563 RepID=UPI001B868FA6|nr:uncharacterized protein EDB93DRAFT_1246766 [Suillus bovinus]KAG2157710.1 hypothetical protein EDB93DRAFT_1246766 [Suillus bovinus]
MVVPSTLYLVTILRPFCSLLKPLGPAISLVVNAVIELDNNGIVPASILRKLPNRRSSTAHSTNMTQNVPNNPSSPHPSYMGLSSDTFDAQNAHTAHSTTLASYPYPDLTLVILVILAFPFALYLSLQQSQYIWPDPFADEAYPCSVPPPD